MSKQIVGLVGYAGSGKDCAAQNMPGWTRVSFADGVREVALAIDPHISSLQETPCGRLTEHVSIVGWEQAKKHPEVRRLLQRIGTEAGRNIIGENVWVDIAIKKLGSIDGPAVFTDVRFPNEVEAIRSLGGMLIRIKRPGVGPVNGHVSEVAIDDVQCDAEVVNDGTPQELGEKILSYIPRILQFRRPGLLEEALQELESCPRTSPTTT